MQYVAFGYIEPVALTKFQIYKLIYIYQKIFKRSTMLSQQFYPVYTTSNR